MRRGVLIVALATLSLAGLQNAFADATTEAQLRAALQSATAQIAQLEDQVANLQASEAPDVATIEALHAQLQTLQSGKTAVTGNESAADKAKRNAETLSLRRQLAAQTYNLSKTQSAYAAASNAAGNASQKNAALKAQLEAVDSGLASCREKNVQMYTLSNQVLDAYSHKDDLFGSIANREPFTQIKRVQLQNIVQDDRDKLDDNQIAQPAGNVAQAP